MQNVLEPGDKLHIMTRRLFEDDVRRHFVGKVIAISNSLVELRGYTFIFQAGVNDYSRLPEPRTRIFGLESSGYVVNKLPREIDVEAVRYKTVDNRVVVTDGKLFSLPINEFGTSR